MRRLDLSGIRQSGWEGDAFDRLGLTFYRPKVPPVRKVIGGGVADLAGMRVGDRVEAIDGGVDRSLVAGGGIVRASAGKVLEIDVARGGSSSVCA